jgi:hypothetical protein
MTVSVIILVINHKHGTDYGLYFSGQRAWDALHDYVVEFWEEDEMGPIPEDQQTAIDEYFEYHLGNEWYDMPIRTLDISGFNLKPSTEEDIR